MIAADLIRQADPVTRHIVARGLAMLASSGILTQQIQLVKDQLVFGSANESVEELAVQVLESRRRIQALNELKQLGDQLKETLNDD